MPQLDNVQVSLQLPYIGEIRGTWKPDQRERDAAWEMYIELITRISVVELKPGEGSLREGLSSLYTLFGTTRDILRKYGPVVARGEYDSQLTFGYISVAMLNAVLRPLLAKWHPLLLDYESRKPESISPLEHEQKWDRSEELRTALNDTREILIEWANVLSDVAGVPSLVIEAVE